MLTVQVTVTDTCEGVPIGAENPLVSTTTDNGAHARSCTARVDAALSCAAADAVE